MSIHPFRRAFESPAQIEREVEKNDATIRSQLYTIGTYLCQPSR
jgi:hypothetical protein